MHSSGPVGRHRQLVLVLEGELYLIPFALLKGSSSNEYLYERFALIAVPSIRSLSPQSKVSLTLTAGARLCGPGGWPSRPDWAARAACELFPMFTLEFAVREAAFGVDLSEGGGTASPPDP